MRDQFDLIYIINIRRPSESSEVRPEGQVGDFGLSTKYIHQVNSSLLFLSLCFSFPTCKTHCHIVPLYSLPQSEQIHRPGQDCWCWCCDGGGGGDGGLVVFRPVRSLVSITDAFGSLFSQVTDGRAALHETKKYLAASVFYS